MEALQYKSGQTLPGTVYRVIRHLATGGMGSVYDVEDETVGKRYVLKTLHPQLVERADLARRMKDEARTLAKLQHPNIVDVITAGVTRDARPMPFYVMERLNGNNLRLLLDKRGSLELAAACQITIDVADALEHAHDNGVVHRDVKPENIFLHRNANGTTTTKLLDFGIMRLLDRKVSQTNGKFIGTLRYASPEQITGSSVGPTTDIYSLGLVLYEMLCGRGPFDDAGDAYAIGAAHVQKEPPPLGRFARVPPPLERLVMAAIAKEPRDRPRDCFTLASELRRLRREIEAGPRSATAVNVLSSIPDTRVALAGDPAPGASRVSDYGATEWGMPAPSMAAATARDAAFGTDPATAPTVASEPQAPPVLAGAPVTQASPGMQAMQAMQARSGSGGRTPAPIDRNAETRASAGPAYTQRVPQHGTLMDDGALLGDDAVRAALAEPAPLEVPPLAGSDNVSGDMVFAPPSLAGGATGPVAGEARTRPPERAFLVPVLVAIATASLGIGIFAIVIKRPWARHETPAMTAPVAAAAGPTSPVAVGSAGAAAGASTVVGAAADGAKPIANANANAPSPSSAPAAPSTAPAPSSRPPGTRAPPAPPPKKAPPKGAPRPEDVGFE